MDAEQSFMRVQQRLSQILSPKIRAFLEYMYLTIAVTLFCILVVMHANYVQQPGCSREFSGAETRDAQLIHIKITSAGLWSQNHTESDNTSVPAANCAANKLDLMIPEETSLPFSVTKFWLHWIGSSTRKGKLTLDFWNNVEDPPGHASSSSQNPQQISHDGSTDSNFEPSVGFSMKTKNTFRVAIVHFLRKWKRRVLFICNSALRISQNLQKLWSLTGMHLNLDVPKWLGVLHLDKVNAFAVQWLEKKSKAFEPVYLYTMEKGYFFLSEASKAKHDIQTVNISISARHPCFGNRWQQLLINRVVGYDTILMNSLLNFRGQGYLYNFQSKEFYNLSHVQDAPIGPSKFGDYLVTKCGVLMMSLFVFFTTTMSVSFTLRETQARMLKFTVQLQHHARHRLPTFQLIFVHVIGSLVFVPIMIGILFFLFEFYDDQLLAFMVLIIVWLCELFTLISVRTPLSMKYFPRFFLLYFLVFHIYFFSYNYGFSYLALSTTVACMQHLILYFWNRFEVHALQRFLHNRWLPNQQQPDFHITSSTILASTLHITRLDTRSPNPLMGTSTGPGSHHPPSQAQTDNPSQHSDSGDQTRSTMENPGQSNAGHPPASMNYFSSLLLWVLGGASYDGFTSFLATFRDPRPTNQMARID